MTLIKSLNLQKQLAATAGKKATKKFKLVLKCVSIKLSETSFNAILIHLLVDYKFISRVMIESLSSI